MRPTIVTTDRISAGDGDTDMYTLPEDQIEQLRAWCRTVGIDPHNTRAVRIEVVDLPLAHAEVYDIGPDGNRFCVPGTRQISMHTEDRPLLAELPDWWQPPVLDRGTGTQSLEP